MSKINNISGKGLPIRGNDIDTDRIIPARFMKCLTFDGLGQFAFYDERYDAEGREKDHALNNRAYRDYSILISNRNFGCGSSREHAPWALSGIGIKCIIAQSYAEIFAGNCSSLGIAALMVSEKDCSAIQHMVESDPAEELHIDLHERKITIKGTDFTFHMPENYRLALIEGKWDTLSMLMEDIDTVKKKHTLLPEFAKSAIL